MFMSVVESKSSVYPELAGARVVITGLTSASGVEIARALADHRARLLIQSPETSSEMTEVAALLTGTAAELQLFNDPFASPDEAVSLVQRAAQRFGGLDALINIVRVMPSDMARAASASDVEAFVAEKLLSAVLTTRVAANRMRLTWTEGSILNVVVMPPAACAADSALADVVLATLAALTRGEAESWAEHGIRINAVGPASSATGGVQASEADIAALALQLVSRKGRRLSGHVLDAAGAAARRC